MFRAPVRVNSVPTTPLKHMAAFWANAGQGLGQTIPAAQ